MTAAGVTDHYCDAHHVHCRNLRDTRQRPNDPEAEHYSRSWHLMRSGETPLGADRLEASPEAFTTARRGSL